MVLTKNEMDLRSRSWRILAKKSVMDSKLEDSMISVSSFRGKISGDIEVHLEEIMRSHLRLPNLFIDGGG